MMQDNNQSKKQSSISKLIFFLSKFWQKLFPKKYKKVEIDIEKGISKLEIKKFGKEV